MHWRTPAAEASQHLSPFSIFSQQWRRMAKNMKRVSYEFIFNITLIILHLLASESQKEGLWALPPNYGPYLASDTDFLKAAEIMTTYIYGESCNDNDKEIQARHKVFMAHGLCAVAALCDLITEDGGHEIDPTRLSYR
ncbi:unnamed protein product [Cylicostephanus goldi]|uniref:Uncharacterized protein n=1 Tax=Cylicostephanus goldi TaxID=71465 RepID=A0A3P6RPP0_CYLGO|nr:unnamed protein product [Cylicostephanus goldi]